MLIFSIFPIFKDHFPVVGTSQQPNLPTSRLQMINVLIYCPRPKVSLSPMISAEIYQCSSPDVQMFRCSNVPCPAA